MSALALLAIALLGRSTLFPALAIIGFAYGGTIAAYPALIAKKVGAQNSARIYGRVFTAWGLAGLGAPWLAGAVFDRTGGYGTALALAAAAAVLSTAAACCLPGREAAQAARESSGDA